jgi:tetratricopeptide (TPR) repeat protein
MTTMEGVLGYWAYQDPRATVERLSRLTTVRKKYLSDDFYRSLAMFHLIAGDTTQARAILRSHWKKLSPAQRAAVRVFDAAVTGDCALAEALFASASAAPEFKRSAEDALSYALAHCQLAAGAYDAAAASLRRIVDREVYYYESAALIPVAWFYLGEAYERGGDVARAVSAYERVLAIWKDGDANLYCRREARARLDRLTAARSM